MMHVRAEPKRPLSWSDYRQTIHHSWTVPLHWIEWSLQWTAYFLSQWAFLEVLEYLGVLSVLFGVIAYISETGDRTKQKHYQAWQVINTAQGKGGSGGRIEALHELNADKVPLVGVDVSGAFLQGVELRRANLLRANLDGVDLRDSMLESASLAFCDAHAANFRGTNLRNADLHDSDLEGADFVGATLAGVDFSGADLGDVDLRQTDLAGIRWQKIKAIKGANVFGVKNAPAGFIDWAMAHGAVSVRGEDD
jgi:pentapeptide repeat protein